MPSLDIEQFTLGVTDNYVNGDPRAAKKLDCLVINEDGKLEQHPGITIYNSSAPQLPSGNQKVDGLYYFDATLFAKSGTNLYYLEDGDTSWTTLNGPTGNAAFADSEVGAKVSWSEWRGHLFATPGPGPNIKGGCRTVKMYRNASGDWTLVQAGLPHFKDINDGALAVSIGTVGPTVIYRYLKMSLWTRTYVAQVNGVSTVFKDFGAPVVGEHEVKDKPDTSDGLSYLTGVAYTNKTNENYDTATLRIETYRTKADQTEFLLAASETDNTEDDIEDDDLGTVAITCFVSSSASAASGIHRMLAKDIGYFYVGLSVILDDDNPGSTTRWVIAVNYSTRDVTLSSTKGGSASNDSAYTTAQNSFLRLNYSAGAPIGYDEANYNDPAPKSYFTAFADGYGWYGAPVDTFATNTVDSLRASRVLQSKPSDPDAVPGGNFVDVPTDKLTALGFAGQHPMAFARNKTFRIEGRYDAFGGGGLRAVLVSETEGAISQDLVKSPQGLLFASENGWCFTDGFSVRNLSENHLRDTYASLANKTSMSGCYDSKHRRSYFGVESSALVPTITGKNNALTILDMKRSSDDQGVFTTFSAGANLQPSAMHYDSKNARLLIGDQRGYIFKFDDSITTVPIVNTGAGYSTWDKAAVVWDWITCAFAFGSTRISKWMVELSVVAKNLTGNLSINWWVYKDDRSTGVRGKAVRDRSITSGLHKIKRNFPKGALSCIYAGIQLKKGFVVIVRSDDYAEATFNGAANTAQINTGNWPEDGSDNLVGHYLYPLQSGSYETGYEITIDSGNTLTVADPEGTLPTGSLKWEVRGYPKNEGVEIHALGIDHQVLGEGYPERSDQGGNA